MPRRAVPRAAAEAPVAAPPEQVLRAAQADRGGARALLTSFSLFPRSNLPIYWLSSNGRFRVTSGNVFSVTF